ncbi:MAG: hypothetical protein KTR18_13740 [Acidiferrobacterales bacterium]|nr:hypothetical protein [Acidiferrobacterales bacterium]
MPANHLLSFFGSRESDDGYAERQRHLHWSAQRFGNIQYQHPWNHEQLKKSAFYQQHQAVLDCQRGAGYWLWKPYLMLEILKEIPEGDFLFYHDVGRAIRRNPLIGYQFDRPIDPLVDWAERHDGMFPGVYVPMYGPSKKWIKRDCFVLMNADTEQYWNQPQVQAGINVWKNTGRVREFFEQWLAFCEDPRILTDQENECGKPNFPEFQDHRHDQAILTILLQQRGIAAYGKPDEDTFKPREVGYITARVIADNEVQRNRQSGQPDLIDLSEQVSPRRYARGTLPFFQLFMEDKRGQSLSILEVCDKASAETQLWKRYLPQANVHTVCKNNETLADQSKATDAITFHTVDTSHRPSMEIFALQMKQQGIQFDFIVECGSGLMRDQQLAVGTLFELLKPGGVFFVEQLEYAVKPGQGDLNENMSNSTMQLIRRVNLVQHKINNHYFSLAEVKRFEKLVQTAGSDWRNGYGTGMFRRKHDNDPEQVKLKEAQNSKPRNTDL